MKKNALILVACLVLYSALIIPFADYMRHKPFVEKMGPIPQAELLRLVSADQKQLVGAALVFKALFYFGTLVDKSQNKLNIPPDYPALSRTIHAAVKLDPYNMDAYYFGQAVLAWDVRQVQLANELMEYGMRYRTWDFYLPLFVGFNSAYFQKDYVTAAKYYKIASDLSGTELYLYRNLAARYMQESGQTSLAIGYLATMLRGERNASIRKIYQLRLQALKGARIIEIARDKYRTERGKEPQSVEELVRAGYLTRVPVDPYHGTYYLDAKGQVHSTSRFAFGAGNAQTPH